MHVAFLPFRFVVFDGDERQGQLSFLDWISDIVHLFSASASADKLRVSDYVYLYLVILNLTFNGRFKLMCASGHDQRP